MEIANKAHSTVEIASAMADIKRVQANDYAPEQKLWHRCAARLSAHGLDLRQLSAQWAERQKLKLTTFEARAGFDRLCQRGCVTQVLAAIVALLRHGPEIKTAWTHFMGNAETRQKTIRGLEKTAQMLEDIWGEFIEAENENELAGTLCANGPPFPFAPGRRTALSRPILEFCRIDYQRLRNALTWRSLPVSPRQLCKTGHREVPRFGNFPACWPISLDLSITMRLLSACGVFAITSAWTPTTRI